MAKKLKISIEDNHNEYQVFGINTVLKDYQLCSLINNFFGLETHLYETLLLDEAFSIFGDEIDKLKVRLVQNLCLNQNPAFPKLKSFEYIVLVNNINSDVADIIKTFEENPEILYISKIDHKYLTVKDKSIVGQLFALGDS